MNGFRVIEVVIKLVILTGFIWGVVCFFSYLGLLLDSSKGAILDNSHDAIRYRDSDAVPHTFDNMAYEHILIDVTGTGCYTRCDT